MALRAAATNVTTSNTEVIAAVAGRSLNVLRVTITNTDNVDHTVILKDATTELFRYPVPSGGGVSVPYGPSRGIGRRITTAAAFNAATVATPTASSVRVEADYGRL